MNALDIQAALQHLTHEPINWTGTDLDSSVYIGDEDNIDAVIVIGPFPADPDADIGAVNVGLNGAEHQERVTDTVAVVEAVARLLSKAG
jgi:hypothetical protein